MSGAAHLTIADPEAMEQLGARIAAQLRAGDAVLLTGELGAGKTTLTRGLEQGSSSGEDTIDMC